MAQPFAMKSSMMKTWSSGPRYFLDTMTCEMFLCVNDSTSTQYTEPSMLMLLAFLAKTAGTSKTLAATAAMPMPLASMVRILLMGAPVKSAFHCSAISLNSFASIWWFRKLSTFRTFPSLTTPSA